MNNLFICIESFKKIDSDQFNFISNLLQLYITFLRSKGERFVHGTVETHINFIINLISQFDDLQINIAKKDFERFMDSIPQTKEICNQSDQENLDSESKHKIIQELFNIPQQSQLISRIIIKVIYELNKKWEIIISSNKNPDFIKDLNKILVYTKNKVVLILGQDTSEMYRLKKIEDCLKMLEYSTIIIKETNFKVDSQSLPEKVSTLGNLVKFIIIENSISSGHLVELEICKQNTLTTILLQEQGKGSTYMNTTIDFEHNYITKFEYSSVDQICDTIKEAVKWAEDYNQKKIENLNKVYPWREAEEES